MIDFIYTYTSDSDLFIVPGEMADHFPSGLVKDSMLKDGFVPDVAELRKRAQHRWLSAAEILEIMKNHERLYIFNAQRLKKPTSKLN